MAIMHGCRCYHTTDENTTIGSIHVERIPNPFGGMPLCIALASHRTVFQKILEHLVYLHRTLFFHATKFLGPLFSLFRTSTLFWGRGRSFLLWNRVLSSLHRRGIPRNKPHQRSVISFCNQGLMNSVRELALRKLSERTRKRGFTGHVQIAGPATNRPNRLTTALGAQTSSGDSRLSSRENSARCASGRSPYRAGNERER